jgi:hypothetical protein
MSLQVNENCHRLFQLTTPHGVLKIYLPEPLEWTNEMSQYYLMTEALLPIRLDDEEEARVYLETKMNECVEIIAKRDLPPPRFILTNIFTLANQTAQPTISPLKELTPDQLCSTAAATSSATSAAAGTSTRAGTKTDSTFKKDGTDESHGNNGRNGMSTVLINSLNADLLSKPKDKVLSVK